MFVSVLLKWFQQQWLKSTQAPLGLSWTQCAKHHRGNISPSSLTMEDPNSWVFAWEDQGRTQASSWGWCVFCEPSHGVLLLCPKLGISRAQGTAARITRMCMHTHTHTQALAPATKAWQSRRCALS